MAKQKSHQGMFSQADYERLMTSLRELNDYITTCDKAEACGVNVAVWRQQRDDMVKQLEAIRQHFMTPAPK